MIKFIIENLYLYIIYLDLFLPIPHPPLPITICLIGGMHSASTNVSIHMNHLFTYIL